MDGEKKRILIVDDEEELCEILQYNLSNAGFFIEIAHSAEEAIKRSLEKFDLILLDKMMGKMSGFQFAEKLHNEMKIFTPFIFISEKNSENDILTGFNIGAEDYITKPFSINELNARVSAVLKRFKAKEKTKSNIITLGNIDLDLSLRRLLINDEYSELTKKECDILRLVFENPGKIFSREEIVKKIWGDDRKVKKFSVDVNMSRLRGKLGEYRNCLCSKRGFGYYFEL